MRRLCFVAGACLLAIALIAGAGTTGEGKKETKGKGVQLPPGVKALNPTPEQERKIREILVDYRGKIDELKKQITTLEAQRKVEWMRVLTAEQKAKFIGEEPKTGKVERKEAAPAKKTEEKK